MLRRTIFVSAFALCIVLSASAAEHGLIVFLARITTDRPSVKWDAKSAVEGDFDGSHRRSFAALGYQDGRVMVAVGRKAPNGSIVAQYLEFGISPDRQNAICALPAHLETAPLTCSDDEGGESLPGCTEAPGVSQVSLVGGECDPIYMYWDHSRKRMVWWRH
jgi:hypothetical protein